MNDNMPDLAIKNFVEDLASLEPEEALKRLYEITDNLRVPSSESESESVEIVKSGLNIISRILRIFGEYYTKVENMDVMKAQGFKKFLENVSRFSENLSSVFDRVSEVKTRVYFDTTALDILKSDIASIIESGGDIGPELKTKVADLIEILKTVPEIPDDLKQKTEFFKQFAEFSKKVLDLLEAMTFIRKDILSLDMFFDEKLRILESSTDHLDRIRKESDEILRNAFTKTAAAVYTLSKKTSGETKTEFKRSYKKLMKDILPKIKGYEDMKRAVKRTVKIYSGKDVPDILKDFSEDLDNVLKTVREISQVISMLAHECIESSGKILSTFVLSSNEANIILREYIPVFESLFKEMMKFDRIAFGNVVNKNLTAIESIKRRIRLAEGEINRMMNEVLSNRKNLQILDDFYKRAYSLERELESRKNKIDQALKATDIHRILSQLDLAGDDITATVLVLEDFFKGNFEPIYKISENLISVMKNLKTSI